MIKCVIGGAFGDEGKGLVTNCISSPNSLVVRFNGGAQAGHTVVMPDGRKHVFHHFGSGSFKGAATFLSRHFVVNPIMFVQEYRMLERLGVKPVVYADPDCPVTLPFDMMMNVALERERGASRHGSCGLGFGETVARHKKCPITLAEFASAINRLALVNIVPVDWQEQRQNETGLQIDVDSRILKRYVHDVDFLSRRIIIVPWRDIFENRRCDVVLEGAQGLRLDMDYPGGFPHVTYSKTGLHNVSELMTEVGVSCLSVYYVTRSYLTRHGNGPLQGEIDHRFPDPTNADNEHQGSMRFASHDVVTLHADIKRDVESTSLEVLPSLVTTCLDQTGGKILVSGEEWPLQDWTKWWARKLPRLLGCGDPTGRSLVKLIN